MWMENKPDLLQENIDLQKIVADKDDIISAQEKSLQSKEKRIRILEEYILSLQQKQFGSSSEKQEVLQAELVFTEAEDTAEAEAPEQVDAFADDTVVVAEHKRKKKRASIPKELHRIEITHDLPEDQKCCPHDGSLLKPIGFESHEQLDIIPASVRVLHHKRLKYACPCCENYLVTAKKPAQPIEKSIASPGLLAHIATQKYVDAMPLYRQTDIFKRIGVEMDRTTLANWMIRCGNLVQPLINLLHERMLEQTILHADETRVQVLNETGRAAETQSFMWVLRSTQPTCAAVLYRYEPTRSGKVITELLRDFNGALMTDGYAAYNAPCEKKGITHLACWAHARRKFIEAQKIQAKGKTGKADQAIAFIQQLYGIEKAIKDKTPEEKYQLRQTQSLPVLQKIKVWLDKGLAHSPPQSLIGKALHYLHEQWPKLVRYVESGDYPIDNNAAENAIRPFVIGRKNWLFSTSPKGATASANLYSVIETAKANGLEPYGYLKTIFTELPNATSLEQIEALLPWNYKDGVS
ncbi:IS66 family element, transposase [Cellvibrio japonicus Ueda107]|uniref:IS66 family element, transposase n=2 Tax=Cellvibrio japonicus TaxID=155077 RepID=B3PC42_CELJU|nr:IS66 family element, transposase [Cellvibrio japonicus Ueda107]ACE84472.1 IS66 family element, transposase [Cellvibrio japonicus Ueda107]ACE85768.1 IS66 family element, transposase [Cellvibrio japonicus Ueda107]